MSNISNTIIYIDKEKTWFWNQSIKKLEFNSKCNGYSDLKRDSESNNKEKTSKTDKKVFFSKLTK